MYQSIHFAVRTMRSTMPFCSGLSNQTSSMSRVKFYVFAQAGNAAILLGSNSFPLVHTAQATRNNLRAKITMDSVVLNRSRSFSAFALLKAMRVNRPLGARMLAGQIR